MTTRIPEKTYFKIGEAAQLVGVETHTIRYWEKEFRAIRPAKTKSRQRLFRQKDVRLLLVIRALLHDMRFTIDGARQRLKELGDAGMTPETILDAIEAGRPLVPDVDEDITKTHQLSEELATLTARLESQNAELAELRKTGVDDLNAKLIQAGATETALRDTVAALRDEIERLRNKNRELERQALTAQSEADEEAEDYATLREEMTRRWTDVLGVVHRRVSGS